MERRSTPQHDADDVQLNVWMPSTLRDALKATARANDESAAQVLRRAARSYVTEHNNLAPVGND
jgi:hypothetical protein